MVDNSRYTTTSFDHRYIVNFIYFIVLSSAPEVMLTKYVQKE